MADPPGSIDRRDLLASAGATGVLLASRPAKAGAQSGGAGMGIVREPVVSRLEVTECTNTAVAASPDGRRLAIDLLNALWILDVGGGAALRLTDDYGEVAQPDWSPDGQLIAFQSFRSGNWQIWTIRSDGSELLQRTEGPFDAREPRFSHDGRRIAFSSDRGGRYAVHLLDLASGAVTALTEGAAQESEPAWSRDGKEIAFVADGSTLVVATLSGQMRTVASVPASPDRFRPSELRGPSFAPDGELAWSTLTDGSSRLLKDGRVVVEGQDLFMFRPAWLPDGGFVYAADGKILRKPAPLPAALPVPIPFTAAVEVRTPDYPKRRQNFVSDAPRPVIGISAPMISPDGRSVAFRALGDIWLMPVGGAPKKLIGDSSYKCDPAFSPDGRLLSYSSDRGGKLDIWIRDLTTGEDRQLTRLANAAVSASWSRDGRMLAFLDQEGSLHSVDVASGDVAKLFEPLWEPGRPSWGPTGEFIAFAAFKPYSARFREGLSEILTVDRRTRTGRYAPIAPHKSLSTRGDDGPVWSPDGKSMAYVFASTLWVAPVDEEGRFTGVPVQITTEVTDAPSWSGDSRSILYLSNGRLRLVPASGGRPRDVPVPLSWAVAKPVGRTLIRAGRLWDGTSDRYREKVDILVSANMIEEVRPAAGPLPDGSGMRVIDAGDEVVIPGLIDMHTHRQMQGYSYGNRQGPLWLSFGITTTRSPGAPAYQMVEEREAVESGSRIGPRHFATGEAIDGSRVFYNFMRPTTEPGQLALEMSRAAALGYDLVKTYVRLPLQAQQEAIARAHLAGQSVSGHYHYPSLNFSADCMEHLGATSRLGYSRTVSPLGAGYQDVIALFTASRAGRTPTLFSSGVLMAEDRSLLDDDRVRTLYPAWEYKRLRDRVAGYAAMDTGPIFASLERNVAQVRAMLAGGGRVLCGTDAPIDFMTISLHLNLRGMCRFGVSPVDALRTATQAPGEFLGEPLGVIARGYLADLVVVTGDPLQRIDDAAAVSATIKNGVLYKVDELLAPFQAAGAGSSFPSTAREQAGVTAASASFWWHDPHFLEHCRSACCAGNLAHRAGA